jgi:pimeloyl-ACP methyl ester carboxylesterase
MQLMAKIFARFFEKRICVDRFFLIASVCVLANMAWAGAALCETNYLKQTFQSGLDGQLDAYAFVLPVNPPASGLTLLVYFHGLQDDYTEPFKIPAGDTIADGVQKEFPQLALLSCNYGKQASWGTRAARIDITHNIQDFMKAHPFDRVILVGNAMGACTALNYAACAPKGLREKIVGVVAFSPVDDLARLYQSSAAPWLKDSLKKALGGTPDDKAADYFNNSLEANIPLFPNKAKVYVVSPLQDTVFPTALQRRAVRTLKNRDVDVKVQEVEGDFRLPASKDVIEGLKFILQ